MAGVYIHIPFCRSKCFYCGFYSLASLQLKTAYLNALVKEIRMRKEYLQEEVVSTLYFGGGTPSCLNESELELILDNIHNVWDIDKQAEYSIEVNPEDASMEKLSAFRRLGFNRITIGVQSFHDSILKRINRSHSASQAITAIENAKVSGFDNIGVDLIIGLPGSSVAELEVDLKKVSVLNIDHVSVYILSLDSNSVFEKLSEKGKFRPLSDDFLAQQYLLVSDYLKSIDYEHYEISNFAKKFKYSRHNTSYWQQKPYIGLGVAAHSYDIISRQWNIAHLKKYIDSLNNRFLNFEKEILTDADKWNEYLMTNFRTMWGIDPYYLKNEYPCWWNKLTEKIENYKHLGLMVMSGERIRMTERGWLVSDGIFSELFV